MANRKLNGLLVATGAAVLLVSVNAMAQTSQRPPVIPDIASAATRASAIKQMGLADQAVGLTSEQKSEIDTIVGTYLAEQKALREKYPVTPGTRSSPEAAKAFRAAQARMAAGLERVLTAEQRKVIQARQEARMAQLIPLRDRQLER